MSSFSIPVTSFYSRTCILCKLSFHFLITVHKIGSFWFYHIFIRFTIDRVLIFYNAYTPPVQQHVYAFFPLLYAFCICSIPFYDRLRLGQTFSYFNRIFFGKAMVCSDFLLLSTVFSSGTLRLIQTFFFLQPYFLRGHYG